MSNNEVNLAGLFQAVTQSLAEKQANLDQADEINRDHGSNMVQTFQIITEALEKKGAGTDSAALRFAAKQLGKKTTSGSGQLYAGHLNAAADQFKGKKVDAAGALQLLQTLIGSSQAGQLAPKPPTKPAPRPGKPAGDSMVGQQMLNRPPLSGASPKPPRPKPSSKPQSQPPQTGNDMMGALLGGLAGGGEAEQQGPQSGDLLGALLGGLTGGQGASQPPSQGGGDLLGALLGGLAGAQSPAQSSPQSGDLLGTLLGGLTGGQGASQSSSPSGDLLGTLLGGLAGGSGGGGGSSNLLPLLIQAFLKNSSMGRSAHREQSTEVVVDSFLQALGSMSRR